MMTNLFSSFDPTSSLMNFPLNWISTILGLMFMPYMFWASPSRSSWTFNKISLSLHSEMKVLLGIKSTMSSVMLIGLFFLIFFNNFLGLVPHVFTSSSHLSMTLSLALPLWVSLMIFGWLKKTTHMLAHLVPLGTPALLSPFMVLIETTSNLIRPGALAVRLSANMIAGHLLLTLLGDMGPLLSKPYVGGLLLAQILLLMLELAVAMIQAYVFSVLMTLYLSEIN